MTGLLSRLRAWIGAVFGGGDDDESADSEAGGATHDSGDGPAVVHRDTRPLETPKTLSRDADHTLTPTAPHDDATPDERDPPRVDVPDAEGDSASADDVEISIPDAEPTAVGEARANDGAETASDAAFVCSVCGTAVDDPDATCPLCHSSDVVPAGERDDDAPSVRGRTAVSNADDDAVDRLRDVRGNGE
ncbi:hypothetical protein [Haloplanus halobius]|uniref:hypothetical protein n=1 Tax=Haloplanus halobius TaxID=2934938 RepID=UPI00200BC2E0|nr:hypothetical protein [Haloplanus sp. XH21]